MKSAVRMYNSAKGTEFLCDQSKGNSWKIICKNNMSGCQWMIRFCKMGGDMWKTGKKIDHNCNPNTYKEDHYNLNSNMIARSLIP
ncbi:hypothetical protein KY284_033173 [Solanum tuberosum]|nr:hypothetical protein KY284_033173 [Solanum tuberosum]